MWIMSSDLCVFLTQMQAGLKDICLADDAFTEFTITHSKKIWTIHVYSMFFFSLPTSHYTENLCDVRNNTAVCGIIGM